MFPLAIIISSYALTNKQPIVFELLFISQVFLFSPTSIDTEMKLLYSVSSDKHKPSVHQSKTLQLPSSFAIEPNKADSLA